MEAKYQPVRPFTRSDVLWKLHCFLYLDRKRKNREILFQVQVETLLYYVRLEKRCSHARVQYLEIRRHDTKGTVVESTRQIQAEPSPNIDEAFVRARFFVHTCSLTPVQVGGQ